MKHDNIDQRESTASFAWVRAISVWLLMCLFVGLGAFVMAGGYFKHWTDHYWAAVWWELAFVASLLPVLAVVIALQRKQNRSLHEIGWRKPTSRAALTLSVILLASYVFGMWMGVHYVLKDSLFQFHWVRLALLPAGLMIGVSEEIIMRGFFMSELNRARVPTWMQILLSAACSAVFHSFTQPTAFFSSFALFGFIAFIYVVGRRSLTAPVLFHSLAHMLCDPYPLNLLLHQQ